MKSRKIIHLDLDAFFCAVEEMHHPELKNTAFAVGGRPTERGVVSSCSYPARMLGIHSAMPMAQAVRLCPRLVIVSPNFHLYREASEQVMRILGQLTPLVEQISIDEAFLDVSDLPEPVVEMARQLQVQIRSEIGLPCSLGVAANKLVAKMATDYGKAHNRTGTYPNAIHVVDPGREMDFLAPLPTQALWGIGPKTAARLKDLGIHTIGELAAVPEQTLHHWFGKMGSDMSRSARGIDDRPVTVEHVIKSVSQEITFDRDIANQVELQDTLRSLSEHVGLRLRKDGLSGTTVRLKLRWPDFTTPTRQLTLSRPTDQDDIIFGIANELFLSLWKPGMPVRLMGVGVSGLGERAYQLSLWDTPSEKEHRLLEAIDLLRERFGDQAVRRARDLPGQGRKRKPGS